MAIIESIITELNTPGVVKWASADLYDRTGEVVITVRFDTPELAAEAYETIASELESDGFRLGSLRLGPPSSAREAGVP